VAANTNTSGRWSKEPGGSLCSRKHTGIPAATVKSCPWRGCPCVQPFEKIVLWGVPSITISVPDAECVEAPASHQGAICEECVERERLWLDAMAGMPNSRLGAGHIVSSLQCMLRKVSAGTSPRLAANEPGHFRADGWIYIRFSPEGIKKFCLVVYDYVVVQS
jgi:hypothetical protein